MRACAGKRVSGHFCQRHVCSHRPAAAITLFILAIAPAYGELIADVEAPAATNVPATLSFEEICQGRLDSVGRITALDAEFTQKCRFAGQHERSASTIPFTFQRNAFKGERRFVFRRRLEYPHRGDLEADVAAAPGLGEYIRVYDGTVQRSYMPYGVSQAAVYAVKDGSADAQFYAHALMLPIADNVRSLGSEIRAWAGWPPDVYNHEGLQWVVEPLCQSVDERVCHVIAEARLGIRQWIDPENGYVVRFQELKQRVDPWRPAGEHVEIRSWNSDFREVAEGIWLPFRIRSVTYSTGGADADNRGAIVSGDDVVAVRLAVNDGVPDSLFDLSFRPGTVVADEIRDVVYIVGKNGEELDPASDTARQLFDGNRGSRATLQWRPSIWLLVNAAVVMSLAALVAMRLLRNRRQSPGRS